MARPPINDTQLLRIVCSILAKNPNFKFIGAFRKALESYQESNNHSEDSFRHRIQRKYNKEPEWKILTENLRKSNLEEKRAQAEKLRREICVLLKPQPQTAMQKLMQEEVRSIEATRQRNIKEFGVADLNNLFKKKPTRTDQIITSLINDKSSTITDITHQKKM